MKLVKNSGADAFADDVAKTNTAAFLQQHGIQKVRGL